METVTITLNGLEVSGHSGMTILELARESGTDIPTLCHDPRLTPAGACRLCLVEDERSGRLVASCVTPISPGMVINTESPRVLERRKTRPHRGGQWHLRRAGRDAVAVDGDCAAAGGADIDTDEETGFVQGRLTGSGACHPGARCSTTTLV